MQIEPYIRTTQYHETDQMGIINHVNYIYWMEEARVDFLEKLDFGYDKAVASGIDFALLGINCQYKAMTYFREQIKIYVGIKAIAPMRLTVSYRMVGASDGKVRFLAESEHCYYSSKRNRPVPLKKELPKLYEKLVNCYEENSAADPA